MSNGLNTKQTIFVEQYLQCWNATEAARLAGYAHPNKRGPENVVKSGISEAINARIAELKMSADEVLLRLADQARGDIGEFAGITDSEDLANHPLSRIVKKYKKRTYRPRDRDSYEEIEIELYNARTSLQLVGKNLGLFDDTITLKLEQEINRTLEHLQSTLEPDTFQKVINALADDSN